jgi:ABC-type sugar transport system substrate-binding protein
LRCSATLRPRAGDPRFVRSLNVPNLLVPIVKKARDAGIVVVTTNTSLAPMTAADAAYETDNLQAGVLIGQWAKATMGSKPNAALVNCKAG